MSFFGSVNAAAHPVRRRPPVRPHGPYGGSAPGVGGGSRETPQTTPQRTPGTPTRVRPARAPIKGIPHLRPSVPHITELSPTLHEFDRQIHVRTAPRELHVKDPELDRIIKEVHSARAELGGKDVERTARQVTGLSRKTERQVSKQIAQGLPRLKPEIFYARKQKDKTFAKLGIPRLNTPAEVRKQRNATAQRARRTLSKRDELRTFGPRRGEPGYSRVREQLGLRATLANRRGLRRENLAERGLIDIKPHDLTAFIGDLIPDTPAEIALAAALPGAGKLLAKAAGAGGAALAARSAGAVGLERGVSSAFQNVTRAERAIGRIESHAGVGIPLAAYSGQHKQVQNLAQAPFQIGKAAVSDPKKFASSSYKTFKEALYGMPAATAAMLTDPKGAAEAIIHDYEYRYGPLLQGDTAEFRRRALEGGLTPYAFDALILAPPAGRLAGSLARGGRLGSRLERFATRERPALRVSGNIVHGQETAKNLGLSAAQAVHDWARGRKGTKAIERGEAIQPKAGEVISLRGKGRRVRDVATRKGRAYISFSHEQSAELGHRGATGEIASLTKNERRGLTYATALGIRDPATAKAVLSKRIEDIKAGRAVEDLEAPGKIDQIPKLEGLIRDADQVFTPKLGEVARLARQRGKRVGVGDPGFGSDAQIIRTYRQQGEVLGIAPHEGESGKAFAARVRETAKKVGLDDPGYVLSQIPNRPNFSARALGGKKATPAPKRYQGKAFRLGIESDDPAMIVQGTAQNIKRKHNWRMVADTAEAHVIEGLRDKTPAEILVELHRRGIDPSEVSLWNPGRFHADRIRAEGNEGTTFAQDELGIENMHLTGEQGALSEGERAVSLAQSDPHFASSRGWSVIPKDVAEEINNVVAGSGKFGRAFDVAKGKQSRILLGAANIPWLQFQIAANALLSGLAGTHPGDWVAASRWWKGLEPEERRHVEPYIGAGHFITDTKQTKMGAAAQGELTNAYRAMKESVGGKGIWKTGGRVRLADLNPLDLMFRADNAQNNFFRRAVLYKGVKREAYRRMGDNAVAIGRLQNHLVPWLSKDARQQMKEIIRDPKALEHHAKLVNDFLGDYVNYTTKERAYLARSVMFYGFLRFSLRFTFWTMPTRHPIVTGILGNLARLKTEEVKKLLGGDELPWALGRIYDDQGRVVVDLARLNPAMNTLTQSTSLNQAFSLLPPMFGHIVEQATNKDLFTGQPFLVEGETQPRQRIGIPFEDRMRIAVREGLNLFYPARVADSLLRQSGPQGADSLFFSPRPTNYSPETMASIEEEKKLSHQDPTDMILGDAFPFAGIFDKGLRGPPGQDARTAARIREQKAAEESQLHPERDDGPFDSLFKRMRGSSGGQFDDLFKRVSGG